MKHLIAFFHIPLPYVGIVLILSVNSHFVNSFLRVRTLKRAYSQAFVSNV